jgi:hypothetical protein
VKKEYLLDEVGVVVVIVIVIAIINSVLKDFEI